jgi:ABC-2 type transport system permease protein
MNEGDLTMTQLINDTRLLFGRSMKQTLRNPVWMILGLFQPMLYLLLFAPLLEPLRGAPGFTSGSSSLNTFAPGLLIMTALFSTAFVGFGVVDDLRTGVIERLRVTPAKRLSLLLGMVLRDVLVLMIQSGVLVLIATLMGLRADPLGIVLVFGLMVLIGTTMSSVSYALAIGLKDESALAQMLNTFMLPLMLLSGITLPLALAPQIIQTLAQFNPFAHSVDAARALTNGNMGDMSILLGFGIMTVLSALAILWAARAFRQATA